jgi:hypothetical protein
MSKNLSVFKTTEAKEQYYTAYEAALKLWPIPYREINIPTRFGATHLIVSGPDDGIPLILFRPAGSPSIICYRNITEFGRNSCTFAVNVIGEVDKSLAIVPIRNRHELADWIIDRFI